MKLSSLSILIPTYNNAPTIAVVLEEALRIGKQAARQYRVVVINDGSTDHTARILEKYRSNARVQVKTHTKNQGYGATIRELYYEGAGSEWMFSAPGDYQVGTQELAKLLPFTERADIIIGWRKHRHDPLQRLLQSRIYNFLLRILFGVTLRDVNSVRLMRGSVIGSLRLRSRSAFVDAELVIKAKRGAGYRIVEVPIEHRSDSHKGSGGNWHTIADTLVDMVRNSRP